MKFEPAGKRLEILKEVIKELARVAVLRFPTNATDILYWQETEATARKLRVEIKPTEARRADDFEAAFTTAVQWKAQALVVFDETLALTHKAQIVALATKYHLPAIYSWREFPEEGGLMSYGLNLVEMFRSLATFVDKIVKGSTPADLPVEQPTRFELVVNMKSAKALGVTVPPTLLAFATELIE